MKIAIVGAGVAGLAALRHSLEEGHDCVVYEQTDQIGGTWVYRKEAGLDSFGLPIHSSMYLDLKTNLPKEVMCFEGFPYKEPNHSFISQPEVLNYILEFSKSFNLQPYIKFFTHVVKITPIGLNRWLVTVQDLKSNSISEKEFDAVIICVGNFSVPMSPKVTGQDTFEGNIIHSHYYRNTEPFRNRNVLIVGSGPSGTDIAKLISSVAKKVYLSYRSTLFSTDIPETVIFKPPVDRIGTKTVLFNDDTTETIDDIIFCTGYRYDYPFLTTECGIEVEENWVKYVYKHVVNINKPTMAFIGIPTRTLPFPIFGVQVRFFLAYLKGNFSITHDEMMNDLMRDIKIKENNGLQKEYYHRLGFDTESYVEDLVSIGKIERLPKVLFKIFNYVYASKGDRSLLYKIINEKEFESLKPCNSLQDV